MKTQMYILSILVLAMGTFLLVHFGLIWAFGRFYVYESNPVVLLGETTMIVAILSYGLFCIIQQTRHMERP